MYRASVLALALTCALAITFVPVVAVANPDVGAEDNGLSIQEEVYLERYAAAQAEFGSAAVGANIVDDGMGQWGPYQVPDDVVADKAERLGLWLNPPAPPPTEVATEATTEASTSASTYTPSGTLEAIAACESGGDPTVYDPSGTYWGKYQFDQATWSSVSDAPYGAASEAEQDAAAAALYAQSGSSPWPVCGG
jgi:hypothetical protein